MTALIARIPLKKRWLGTWPALCDLCRHPLSQVRFFVDGRLPFTGHWALMCPECFEVNGVKLGIDRGQKYNSNTLEKVED
jgi:hypothetical protein